MKEIQNIKSIYFTFILSLFGNLCFAQKTTSFPVDVKVIHQDSISIKAETQPEYRNSVLDIDYQGNQISGVVRTVFQDSKENFWFGTQNGLCRKNKEGLVYFDLRGYNNRTVTVYSILEDKSQNIWIAFDEGIAKFDGVYFTVFHQKDILKVGGLWNMTMDKKGVLWLGTTEGAYTFNGETLSSFEIPEGKLDPDFGTGTKKMINSILEDRDGKLWFATNGGVYTYDGSTLQNFSEINGLQSDFVGQIIESSKGSIFISTNKGIFSYDGKSFTNITEKLIKDGDRVACVFEDKNGTLWFTVNKREIYNYNGSSFTKIESKVGEFNLFPFQIYQDQQKRLWFVGLKGAYRYENNNFINVNRNGPW